MDVRSPCAVRRTLYIVAYIILRFAYYLIARFTLAYLIAIALASEDRKFREYKRT